jgi:hypothetical protein
MRLIYVWIPAPRLRGDKLCGNNGCVITDFKEGIITGLPERVGQ